MWEYVNVPKAAPDTTSSSTGPSGCVVGFGTWSWLWLDPEKPHLPKNDDPPFEESPVTVSVADLLEFWDAREGVEGFREGKGLVAGVTYESKPEGKTVL